MSTLDDASATPACVENIGPRERRRRMTSGVVSLAVGVLAVGLMVGFGIDRWWRLLLLLPFWAGWIGYFQAREHT